MQPSNAEVRAGAVAKLKRAASLPRINGGRRPPMHSEGASEGEKSKDDSNSKHGDDSSKNATSDERDDHEQREPRQQQRQLQDQSQPQHGQPNGQPPHAQSPSPKRSRRSRSRSRSRSKDLKDLKPPKSPPPRDSSPEEKLVYPPALDDVPVASPTPTRPTGIAMGPRLPFSPPTAPSTPSPQTAVPTLQDLQQRLNAGLFRSQSASRAAAMMKLTGGTAALESPQPQSPRLTVSRSNTVTGVEQRAAAAKHMLGRLQHRVGGQLEEIMTSGGEDVPPAPPKRRRRRSRRASGAGSGGASSSVVDDRDDRDPPSTSPNTPIVPQSPLPSLPPNPYPESPHQPIQGPSRQVQEQTRSAVPPSPPLEDELHEAEIKADDSHTTPVSRKQWPQPIFVEDDDEEPPVFHGPFLQPPPSPPHTPQRDSQDSFTDGTVGARGRVPHSSDAPSSDMTVSSGHVVPVIMSSDNLQPSPFRQDEFPTSPFHTPLKEPLRDDEEEEIVFREDMKARRVWHEKLANGNGIQWPRGLSEEAAVIPIQDEEEEELVKVQRPPPSNQGQTPLVQQDPRTSEFTSPSPGGTSYAPPSPSVLALSHTTATTRESVDSSLGPSPGLTNFPNKTGVFTPRPESYTDTGTDWEESGVHTDREGTAKRATDGSEKSSTWAKVKNTFAGRSGSISGRRSRANSTSKREDKAANRESGASGVSGNQSKYSDHGGASTAPPSAWSSPGLMYAQLAHEQHRAQEQQQQQQQRQLSIQTPSAWSSPGIMHAQLAQDHHRSQERQLPMQSPSASASNMSLAQTASHRGGPSPVPPASPADLSKYTDSKLMPFPGLVKLKLDEERKKQRSRRISASVSSPNLPRDLVGPLSDASHGIRPTEMEVRERKLSHQYSDSGLLQKARNANYANMDNHSQVTQSTPNQVTSSAASSSSWLPMSRKDLKKWYKANKFLNTSSPATPISTAMISPPILDGRFDTNVGSSSGAQKKPSLSDILVHQPGSESATEWEDGVIHTTPKGRGKGHLTDHEDAMDLPPDPFASPQGASRVHSQQGSVSSSDSVFRRDSETDPVFPMSPIRRSPTRPALSVIPEPFASDDSWTRSASQASSNSSAPLPTLSNSPETQVQPPDRTSLVFQRLDLLLSRDPNDHMRWSFLEDPPRKLIMSSSVTQVVNSDTIRERFLFLFNDILVVAKPLQPTDRAMDRMFIVKNIIDLQTVCVITDRDEGAYSPSRHPLVQMFVREFGAGADSAVAALLQSSGLEDDQMALGKLLYNTFELDRTRLGGYLSKKSRKAVLRSYIDCFGFSGVRLEHALRTFILSVRLPTESPEHALEHLLNTFASKWFDANARLVSFDKDLATKLVRIIVHLDNQIHKASGGPPQMNGFGPRDFRAEWETMVRALDPRGLLSDELIYDIYYSLRRDPLRWAADSQFDRLRYSIVFKRPPPNHLAHRVQSDPIILRIPHPDPHLRIQLLSQDGIMFDPPELNFTRSMEVAFRVTGTSLGPKSIIFSLVGPNAPLYSGIPFSKTVVVERHFMRNTFQVAFDDQRGMKRRYMFSAEDALVCHQWALSLRQPRPTKLQREPESSVSRRVQKAAKAVSLEILREAIAHKLSGHDLIVICKQNSLIPGVLPTVTTISPSS